MLPSRRGLSYYDEREWNKWRTRLTTQNRGLIARKLERVQQHGVIIGMPLVRQLSDELHELRVKQYRVYFVHDDTGYRIITQGVKDTQQRDIERAQGRLT